MDILFDIHNKQIIQVATYMYVYSSIYKHIDAHWARCPMAFIGISAQRPLRKTLVNSSIKQ